MLDGQGNPGTAPAYAAALEALYSVSYAVKFASRHSGRDYVVGPLEGLWTADDPDAFTRGEKEDWKWTMMIPQPGWISAGEVQDGIAKAAARHVPGLDLLRLETLDDGLSTSVGWHRKSSKPSCANPCDGSEPFRAGTRELLLARRGIHWLGSAVWLN
ncbi:hypothetical protein [Pseudarthrobacter sp. AB1]|uniref:hypothetical protein n=1 Tax=Pseudarthrobacter sp. AB1 TaxID=2138309 RepID=UPI00186BA92C|nr:hypothetical protein [Pseudarthrobacter sp. AB1]